MVLNRILVNGNGLQWGFETGASSERLVSVAGARLVKVLRVGPLVFDRSVVDEFGLQWATEARATRAIAKSL